MTALDLLDRTIASLPIGDPIRKALLNTRAQVAEQEDTINEARQTIEKMDEVIKKVTSPANRIGIFLGSHNRETVQIVVGGLGLLLQRRSAHQHQQAQEGHPGPRQRGLCGGRRTGLRPVRPGGQDHRGHRQRPAARRSGQRDAVPRPATLHGIAQGNAQGGRRGPRRFELPHGDGVDEAAQERGPLPGRGARAALGKSRRPAGGAASHPGCHRAAAAARGPVRQIQPQHAEGLPVVRPARLRQDAHRQGHRV